MKNNILLISILCSAANLQSQVGINTSSPQATLDVAASPSDQVKADGFIAPRLTGSALKSKDNLYGASQMGAIVFATTASPDAGQDA